MSITSALRLGLIIVLLGAALTVWLQHRHIKKQDRLIQTKEAEVQAYKTLAETRRRALEDERVAAYERAERVAKTEEAHEQLTKDLESETCDIDLVGAELFNRLCGSAPPADAGGTSKGPGSLSGLSP
jgi:hypothetical protein